MAALNDVMGCASPEPSLAEPGKFCMMTSQSVRNQRTVCGTPARAATSELAAAGILCADQPYRAKAMRFCKGETGPRMRLAGFQEIMLCATMTLRPNPDAGTAYGASRVPAPPASVRTQLQPRTLRTD